MGSSLRFMACLCGSSQVHEILVISKNEGSVFIQAQQPVMNGLGALKNRIFQSLVLDTNLHIDEAPRCPRFVPGLASSCFGSENLVQLRTVEAVRACERKPLRAMYRH